jgi:hypothetical protein
LLRLAASELSGADRILKRAALARQLDNSSMRAAAVNLPLPSDLVSRNGPHDVLRGLLRLHPPDVWQQDAELVTPGTRDASGLRNCTLYQSRNLVQQLIATHERDSIVDSAKAIQVEMAEAVGSTRGPCVRQGQLQALVDLATVEKSRQGVMGQLIRHPSILGMAAAGQEVKSAQPLREHGVSVRVCDQSERR